ncbi:MAG: chorismate synthase [Bacteroidales bacterium]|nr:chorismate synthase [Bacteroidales bacterium]
MNEFGTNFKISIFGASHAANVGIRISGVPAGIPLCREDFIQDILRRKSGAKGTTSRIEDDIPAILNGVSEEMPVADSGRVTGSGPSGVTGSNPFGITTSHTTGEEIIISFENKNIRPQDYSQFKDVPRPGHADYTASVKYGTGRPGFDNTDFMGGGFFSGRMTLPLVAAGVVAKKVISPVRVEAKISEIGGIPYDRWEKIEQLLDLTAMEGDSLGGIIECTCIGVPAGIGEPFFNSLESLISHAVFSIPGIRAIEFGDGFKSARMKGSGHNDCFMYASGHTATNGCGGINGGISNGNPVVFRVAVKPTSSISKAQETFNFATGQMAELSAAGRHDTCFALRVPPVVEAVTACVIADLMVERAGDGQMSANEEDAI